VILTMPGMNFLASIVATARCPETAFELGTKSQASRRTGLVSVFESAFRIKKGLHQFTDWSKAWALQHAAPIKLFTSCEPAVKINLLTTDSKFEHQAQLQKWLPQTRPRIGGIRAPVIRALRDICFRAPGTHFLELLLRDPFTHDSG